MLKRLTQIARIRQGYGMTELCGASHCTPAEGKTKFGSVGLLMPNLHCKVINPETGEILGPNQNGEICVKGPLVMMGYTKDPEATAKTIDSDGWLYTGDIGHYDDDEYFFIVDRIKELIKYKGFQASSATQKKKLAVILIYFLYEVPVR